MIGIVADDLTGACDSAAQFAERGAKTFVWLGKATALRAFASRFRPDVLAVTTQTRNAEAIVAARSVGQACRALIAAGANEFFKKIDSGMRGPVAWEALAMLETCGLPAAAITPAWPRQGREVVAGSLLVRGTPAHLCEWPSGGRPRTSYLPLLLATAGQEVGLVRYEPVNAGKKATARALEFERARGVRLVCLDARTPKDLRTIASLTQTQGWLPVGSAGLGAAVAGVHDFNRKGRATGSDASYPWLRRIGSGPIIVALGSPSPATRQQTEAAVRVRALELLGAGKTAHGRRRNGPALGLGAEGATGKVSRRVYSLVKSAKVRAAALIIVGGGTSFDTLRLLKAEAVQLYGEAMPSVAAGRLMGGPHDGLTVLTKGGSVGDRACLVRLIRLLQGTQRRGENR